jgi:hypothetical protein
VLYQNIFWRSTYLLFFRHCDTQKIVGFIGRWYHWGLVSGLWGIFLFTHHSQRHAMLVLRKKEHHPHIHKVPVG